VLLNLTEYLFILHNMYSISTHKKSIIYLKISIDRAIYISTLTPGRMTTLIHLATVIR